MSEVTQSTEETNSTDEKKKSKRRSALKLIEPKFGSVPIAYRSGPKSGEIHEVGNISELPVGKKIYVSHHLLMQHPLNPRSSDEYTDPSVMQELRVSINSMGINEALRVVRLEERHSALLVDHYTGDEIEVMGTNRLMLFTGHRRLNCHRSLAEKRVEREWVPIIIEDMGSDPEKANEAEMKGMVSSNSGTRDIGFNGRISIYENWALMRQRAGWDAKKTGRGIAQALGISATSISRIRAVLSYGDPLRRLFTSSKVGENIVADVNKVRKENKATDNELAEKISGWAEEGLTAAQMNKALKAIVAGEEQKKVDESVLLDDNNYKVFRGLVRGGLEDKEANKLIRRTKGKVAIGDAAAATFLSSLIKLAATEPNWADYFVGIKISMENDMVEQLLPGMSKVGS